MYYNTCTGTEEYSLTLHRSESKRFYGSVFLTPLPLNCIFMYPVTQCVKWKCLIEFYTLARIQHHPRKYRFL